MTYADYLKFNIQWAEWISAAGLGSDTLLPAADSADFHLGAYDKTKGMWFNPDEKSGKTGWASGKIALSY